MSKRRQTWEAPFSKSESENRPPTCIAQWPQRPGNCRVPGCGQPFYGPPSRRYCDQHSMSRQFRGKV